MTRSARALPRRLGPLLVLVLALVVLVSSAGVFLARSLGSSTDGDRTFTFGAVGDHGANERTAKVLQRAGASDLDFFQSLGDLSYGTIPPGEGCQMGKDNLNAGAGRPQGDEFGERFPFLLLEGNHDERTMQQYLAPGCLPDRMGVSASPLGGYGREFHYDYPKGEPLARFIMTSHEDRDYKIGTPQYQWLSDTIDAARAGGIKWVIVGSHANYVSNLKKKDEVGSDYFNLLVAKKVDLLLQAHDHGYQRSKQLALGPDCPRVPINGAQPACIVADGATGQYAAGAGMVVVIDGSGGRPNYDVTKDDPDAPYFAKVTGANREDPAGFTKVTVSASAIRGEYMQVAGKEFRDSFVIGSEGEDAAAPGPPTGVSATASSGTEVDLRWEPPPPDAQAAGYRVARDGTAIGSTSAVSFRDATAHPGATHSYTVTPYAADGDEGKASDPVSVTSPAGDTMVFVSSEDATVSAGAPDRRDGSAPDLKADKSGPSEFLVKIPVRATGGERPVRARLQLFTVSPSHRGGEIRRVATSGWSERDVTWRTAPATGSAVVAKFKRAAASSWVEADVTPVVTGDGTYSFRVAAPTGDGVAYLSSEGGRNAPRLLVTLGAPDTSAPGAPGGLTATPVGSSVVDLRWAATQDDRLLSGYRVFRDGRLVGSVRGTRFRDIGLTAGSDQTYTVRAVDVAGNVSPDSGPASVRTKGPVVWITQQVQADAEIVASAPSRSYSGSRLLTADSNPQAGFLVRVDVRATAGRTITSATLRLYTASATSSGGRFFPTDKAWDERTVTWASAPAPTGQPLDELGALEAGTWARVDITRLVTGEGVYSVRADSLSPSGVDYNSREAEGNQPEIVLGLQ